MKRIAGAALLLSLAAAAGAGTGPAASPVASARSAGGKVEIRLGQIPAGATEWESFLSLDGGRSFPLRITPHLDTSVDFFSWSVPGLVSDDARIRIRFGDGRSEREVDLPGSFRLVPALHSRLLLPSIGDLGKKPCPGEEGLAGWVEGTPGGERLRFIAPPPLRGLEPSVVRGFGNRSEAILEQRRWSPPLSEPFARTVARTRDNRTPPSRAAAAPFAPLDKTSRLNL